MKHSKMVELMGKVVTVHRKLVRNMDAFGEFKMRWIECKCSSWSGWIVGFRWKLDGKIEGGYELEDPSCFVESKRTLCAMVVPWPTMVAIPTPLSGFELGGLPQPPDYGGWKGLNDDAKEKCRKELSEEAAKWPRDSEGRWVKESARRCLLK